MALKCTLFKFWENGLSENSFEINGFKGFLESSCGRCDVVKLHRRSTVCGLVFLSLTLEGVVRTFCLPVFQCFLLQAKYGNSPLHFFLDILYYKHTWFNLLWAKWHTLCLWSILFRMKFHWNSKILEMLWMFQMKCWFQNISKEFLSMGHSMWND